jgi:hypothetical protein
VIAIEQRNLAHRPEAAMDEWMVREPRRARPHQRLVRDAAERNDGAELRHFGDCPAEKIAAGGDFLRGRLVLGRHAADRIGDAAVE